MQKGLVRPCFMKAPSRALHPPFRPLHYPIDQYDLLEFEPVRAHWLRLRYQINFLNERNGIRARTRLSTHNNRISRGGGRIISPCLPGACRGLRSKNEFGMSRKLYRGKVAYVTPSAQIPIRPKTQFRMSPQEL